MITPSQEETLEDRGNNHYRQGPAMSNRLWNSNVELKQICNCSVESSPHPSMPSIRIRREKERQEDK